MEKYIERGEYSWTQYKEEIDGVGPIGSWVDRSPHSPSDMGQCVGPQEYKHPYRSGHIIRAPRGWVSDPTYLIGVSGNGTLQIHGTTGIAPLSDWSLIAPADAPEIWAALRLVSPNGTEYIVGVDARSVTGLHGGVHQADFFSHGAESQDGVLSWTHWDAPELDASVQDSWPAFWNATHTGPNQRSTLRHPSIEKIAGTWAPPEGITAVQGGDVLALPSGITYNITNYWFAEGTTISTTQADVRMFRTVVGISLEDGWIRYGANNREAPKTMAIDARGGLINLNGSHIRTPERLEASQVLTAEGALFTFDVAMRPACELVEISTGTNWWLAWSVNETTATGQATITSAEVQVLPSVKSNSLGVYLAHEPADPLGDALACMQSACEEPSDWSFPSRPLGSGSFLGSRLPANHWNEFHTLFVPWDVGEFEVKIILRGPFGQTIGHETVHVNVV